MKKTITCLFAIFFLSLPALIAQIITNPDSVEIYPGDTILVDVLVNDYEINNDSIYVHQAYGFPVAGNRYIEVFVKDNWWGKTGVVDTIMYRVHQVNGSAIAYGYLYITFVNESFNTLDINNLDARFYAFGNHFWDLSGSSEFFAPKNTVKTPFFNSTFWIGGKKSTTGQLHLSAERYRQVGKDFYAGPVSTVYDSLYDRKWNRIWKLTTIDILYHLAYYNTTGYVPFRDIWEWPAHGDTTLGQPWNLAPFFDSNNNGIYEPMAGDYPKIRGNMTLFFIFNDVRLPNTESGGTPLGIEVHGMAYAFDQPTNSMLNNTIFMHYDIINRSANQYDSTWVGIFNDFDLGWAFDDYVGTHVKHGAVYAYNGSSVDGSGQLWAYGANPPVMAMQILAGPYMDPDGLDNPKSDSLGNPLCNVSLNGANFGDGITDNERMGLSQSIYLTNISGSPYYMMDPATDNQYYNNLRGIWKDDSMMFYGGNGHTYLAAYGPECSFIFPGDSDSCNFGTGGLPPNGPVYWTEQTAGNQPGDRRILASSGPFTFLPGDRHSVDVAFLFSHDVVNNKPFDTLVVWMDSLKNMFLSSPAMFDPVFSVAERTVPAKNSIIIYPNPASDKITITGLATGNPCPYQIFSLAGQLMASGNVTNGTSLTISHLKTGLYIIRVFSGNEVISRKFIRE